MHDNRKNYELTVQICQSMFHTLMAVIIAYGIPQFYLDQPVDSVWMKYTQSAVPEPWGVRIPYFLSATYHGVLYFWDPLSTTTMKAHHIATILLGTVLMVYGELGWGLAVMMLNYLFDSADFVQHRLKNLHPNRIVIASMIKIHHMVTILLLAVSWIYNFTSFGMIILFIHDVTDVPMFVIRILRRQGVSSSSIRQILVGVGVATSWIYFRVYWLGFYIVHAYTFSIQHYDDVKKFKLTNAFWMSIGGMSVLWCFNVYWTFLVIYKFVREILLGKTPVYNE